MTTEQIREKLLKLHNAENGMNKEMSKIDWEVKELQKRKIKITKMVSSNMKYRNQLINKL
jgi:hypothetical protein